MSSDSIQVQNRSVGNAVSSLLPRSKFGKRVTTLGLSAIINLLLQAVSVPWIGRLYGPSAFGQWAYLQSIAAVVATIAGLRYELAVVVSQDEDEARRISIVHFFTTLLFSSAVTAIFGLFGAAWMNAAGMSEVTPYLISIPICAVLSALYALLTNWLIRLERFNDLARTALALSGMTALGQIGAAFLFNRSLKGIVVGGIVGQLAPFALIPSLTWAVTRIRLRSLSMSSLWTTARKHDSFPLFMVPWSLTGSLRDRGLIILLGIFASSKVMGFYSLALRLVLAPQTLALNSLSSVLFQRAAEAERVSEVAPLVRRVNIQMSSLMVPTFIFLAWWAKDLIAVLLGEKWRGAGTYVSLLCAPAFGLVLQNWLIRLLTIARRQRDGFILEALYTVVSLTAFWVSFRIWNDPLIAVGGFAMVTVFYNVAFFLVCYRTCEFPLRDLLQTGRRILFLAEIGRAHV